MTRRIRAITLIFLLLFAAAVSLFVQTRLPDSAEVNLYFPQFADGVASSGQWQTIFTFSNPNNATGSCTCWHHGNHGKPLLMALGNGFSSSVSVFVPPKETFTRTSTMASATAISGWAHASASLPVQAVVNSQPVSHVNRIR